MSRRALSRCAVTFAGRGQPKGAIPQGGTPVHTGIVGAATARCARDVYPHRRAHRRIDIDRFPVAKFLPLSWGSKLIGRAMIDGTRLWEMAPADLLFLVANGVVYFAVGFSAFKLLERQARHRGLLGHY